MCTRRSTGMWRQLIRDKTFTEVPVTGFLFFFRPYRNFFIVDIGAKPPRHMYLESARGKGLYRINRRPERLAEGADKRF
jgi:hypothetical protein